MNVIAFSQLVDGAGFQISTILISFSCMYFTFQSKRKGRIHSEIYMMMQLSVAIAAVCNLVSAFTKDEQSNLKRVL